MRTEFHERLTQAGNNRQSLTSLMAELDEEKRSIAQNLSRLSSEPGDDDPVGQEKQNLIKNIKHEQSLLKEEREIVRLKLGQIKADTVIRNRISHSNPEHAYLIAYATACEVLLDDDTLAEIESKAYNILDYS